MKALTYLLTGILIFLSAPGQAQIRKGDWMLGGNGFLNFKLNSPSQFQMAVSPNAGLFLNDKLVVGLQPTLGYFEIFEDVAIPLAFMALEGYTYLIMQKGKAMSLSEHPVESFKHCPEPSLIMVQEILLLSQNGVFQVV